MRTQRQILSRRRAEKLIVTPGLAHATITAKPDILLTGRVPVATMRTASGKEVVPPSLCSCGFQGGRVHLFWAERVRVIETLRAPESWTRTL